MSKLWMALGISLVGHIWAWFHMQGQFKWEWAKSIWWIVLGGIPISFAFYYGGLYLAEFQSVLLFGMELSGIMNTLEIIGMLDLLDSEWQQ